jgi:NitT/TauT family transport system substrate-binding protein
MIRLLFSILAALSVFGGAAAQETLKISAPQRGAWDTSVPELGQRAGIFKKYGLVLDILYTSGGAESQQGVISGSLDFAVAVGISSVLTAYSKGAPVRIIGSEMIGSPDLYWYVKPDSPIKSFKDAADKTVGYSVTGSSSHAALLRLLAQAGVSAKPNATGGMPGTLTQAMSGQIDIGWAAAPFGLADINDGKVRIIGRGSDVESLRGQTVRVNITNVQMMEKRRDTVERFMQAYRETLDWMYSSPDALKIYEEFSKVPESLMKTGRDQFFPKPTMLPDKVAGLDQILDEAQKLKFISAPLTKEQIAEMIQIPAPPKK